MAKLIRLGSSGEKLAPTLASTELKGDGSYTFYPKSLGIPLVEQRPAWPLLVEIEGCAGGTYSRPITAVKNQDVSVGSTLITYMLNSDLRENLTKALETSSSALNTLLVNLAPSLSYQDAYDRLQSNGQLEQKFTDIFGVAPAVLTVTAPEITSLTVPASASEGAAVNLSVVTTHWSSTYGVAYEWKVDGQNLASSASTSWTPGSNAQGSHVVSLRIGTNDGSGEIDATKPVKLVEQNIQVTNTILPTAPQLTVVSPVISGNVPINTTALTLSMQTGTGLSNCASFSSLALTENSATAPAASEFTITCTQAGTQSLSYNLTSSTDGLKTLKLWSRDSSGTVSVSPSEVSFYLDRSVPVAEISGTPAGLTNSASQTLSFTADDNGGVIERFECKIDASVFSTCTSPKTYSGLTEGAHVFSVRAIDTAGNVSNVVSHNWSIDLTAPTLSFATPSVSGAIVPSSGLSNISIGGACSENGRAVTISGAAAASVNCASNTWSATINLSSASEGNLVVSAAHTDAAGNSATSATKSFIKDTTAPVLTMTTPAHMKGNGSFGSAAWTLTEVNVTAGASFSVELYNGSSWSSVGSKTVSTGANVGTTYSLTSFTTPAVDTDSARMRVSFTDAAGNIGQVTSGSFPLQTTPPSVSAFSIAQGSSTSLQMVQVAMSASDPLSLITHFCILMNTSTPPALTDPCWTAVNAPAPGITPAKNISFSGFYYPLGFTSGNYTLNAFVKNSQGMISALSGSSTASIFYTSPVPPIVVNVISSNTDVPLFPTDPADSIVGAGGNVYVKWKATDATGFGASAIAIEYTLDGTTYLPVAAGLANAGNGGCTPDSPATSLDDGNTGCYVWSGGAPSSYFAIRVRATNNANLSSSSQGNFLNSGKIVILAGNVDSGVSGSAKAAIMKTRKAMAYPITQQFAVLPDGKIIIIDATYGLVIVDPNNGMYSVLIPRGAAQSTEGDGGPVYLARVKAPSQLTVDYLGNIYVWDESRIRKITTTGPTWTINTIIGGGETISGNNIPGLSLKLAVLTGNNYTNLLSARPDGSLWFISVNQAGSFTSTNPPYVYSYSSSTGLVTNHGTFGGTGTAGDVNIDLTNLSLTTGCVGFSYNPLTSQSQTVFAMINQGSGIHGTTRFNPNTLMANRSDPLAFPYTNNLNINTSLITGLDGRLYSVESTGYIRLWDEQSNWIHLAGSGSGICDDGTLAKSCKMNLQDVFVDTKGKIYFLENSLIRTLDNDGKVVTLAGQPSTFGDELAGKEARFGLVKGIATNSSGDVYILDSENFRIRKWTRSNKKVSLVAGNNTTAVPDTTALAKDQPISVDIYVDTGSIATLPTTGELVYSRGNAVAKLNASTGRWEDIAGGGTTHYISADGLALGSIQLRVAYNPKVIGATSSRVLVANGTWSNAYMNGVLKTYDIATGLQTQFAGIGGASGTGGLPSDGTVLATSSFNHSTSVGPMSFDSTAGAWYATTGKAVKKLVQGGTISHLFTDNGNGNIRSVTHTRKNGNLIVYYCAVVGSNWQLRKWEEATNTFTTLPWPSTSISCLTNNLVYSASTDSLIFGFSLGGGLQGVAEYTAP